MFSKSGNKVRCVNSLINNVKMELTACGYLGSTIACQPTLPPYKSCPAVFLLFRAQSANQSFVEAEGQPGRLCGAAAAGWPAGPRGGRPQSGKKGSTDLPGSLTSASLFWRFKRLFLCCSLLLWAFQCHHKSFCLLKMYFWSGFSSSSCRRWLRCFWEGSPPERRRGKFYTATIIQITAARFWYLQNYLPLRGEVSTCTCCSLMRFHRNGVPCKGKAFISRSRHPSSLLAALLKSLETSPITSQC